MVLVPFDDLVVTLYSHRRTSGSSSVCSYIVCLRPRSVGETDKGTSRGRTVRIVCDLVASVQAPCNSGLNLIDFQGSI